MLRGNVAIKEITFTLRPEKIDWHFLIGYRYRKEEIANIFFFSPVTGFFKDLLATSKRGFHEMFKKTYGILYEQNAYVFTDLFKELENYYAKGTVRFDFNEINRNVSDKISR